MTRFAEGPLRQRYALPPPRAGEDFRAINALPKHLPHRLAHRPGTGWWRGGRADRRNRTEAHESGLSAREPVAGILKPLHSYSATEEAHEAG